MIIIAYRKDFYNILFVFPGFVFSRIALTETSPAKRKRVEAIKTSAVVPVLRASVS